MLNFQVLFICIVCFSVFLFSNATFTTTTTKSTDKSNHDVVDKISQELLSIRQEINNAINHSNPKPINFTLLQNSFAHLHQVILEKINQSDTLAMISYNDSITLTKNVLMTINLVIERVHLNCYSTKEKSAILTSVLAIYKDYSRILGSHLKSFKPPKLNLDFWSTYVQLKAQQFSPKNAHTAVFSFWSSGKQKLIMLELPIDGIASADREENVTVTIVVSFLPKKYAFLDVQSPLISITIDNQTQVQMATGHQFNFTWVQLPWFYILKNRLTGNFPRL